jgi:selenocysteine lyase/cysteine desulfurase
MDILRIRSDFPALKEWTYLDTSFMGLSPLQVRQGYEEFLDRWMLFKVAMGKTILSEWLEKGELVRNMVASFLGATRDEIAFTTSTGCGLNIVINGISWSKGDNVVFPEWEHNPTDTMTLRRHGVQVRTVKSKGGRIELADLEKVIDDRTKLVQVSQVAYTNGFRFNLKKVGEIAHEHGAMLLVDGTQAIGALLINLKEENVDFLSAAPYKYLMGPAGLAFLYVRRDRTDDLIPDRVGWKNQIWEGERAERLSESGEAGDKFEYGTLHYQGMYALERSLEYISRIGLENVESRILELSSYLWYRLNDLAFDMYTPKGTKSPIVSFFQPDATIIAGKLMEEKVKVSGRPTHGGHIRVSTHFYNTSEDIDHFIERLMDARSGLKSGNTPP